MGEQDEAPSGRAKQLYFFVGGISRHALGCSFLSKNDVHIFAEWECGIMFSEAVGNASVDEYKQGRLIVTRATDVYSSHFCWNILRSEGTWGGETKVNE